LTINCGNKVLGGVAQQILHQVHLLVVLRVHEIVVFAVVVQVLHFLLFEQRLLHLVLGREAMLGHGAAAQAAHSDLHEPSQIAGGAVIHAENGVQLVVELDDHPRAQLCCGNHETPQ